MSGRTTIRRARPAFASVWTVALLVGPASADAIESSPGAPDLDVIRAVPVQHAGRWAPLDTAARDVVETVTGHAAPDGRDAVWTFLAWNFQPDAWSARPLIEISNAELRHELALPADRTGFSYRELVSHARLRELIAGLAELPPGRKLDPLQSKVAGIREKLDTLDAVFAGSAVRPVPHPVDPFGTWMTPAGALRLDASRYRPAAEAWNHLAEAFRAEDTTAFLAASRQLRDALASLPAAYRPSADRLQTELQYNRLAPFRIGWQVMAAGAVLAGAALLARRRPFDAVAAGAMLVGFGVLAYGLWLRWQIAGRIPAANMFESLLFLSGGMGAFAIVSLIAVRDRVVPVTASFLGALALFLADVLPLDSYIRPIPAVLAGTIWMSIHVPVIMVSYSVLALAMLVAHVQIVVHAVAPGRRALIESIDRTHYWYVHVGSILLFVGIVTGSMWAASSWGRYWGWDPKEVWSLIAFLCYVTLLHVRVDTQRAPGWAYGLAVVLVCLVVGLVLPRLAPITAGKAAGLAGAVAMLAVFVSLRGPFATACKSILGFWTIIMTYVGVNFVLGIGLHSYGFGTGAVVRYLLLTGVLELIAVAVCAATYAARRGIPVGTPSPAGVSSA